MSKRKIAAFDLDGVVADYIPAFLPHANECFGRNLSCRDLRFFDIASCFGVSPEEMMQLMVELGLSFVAGLPPVSGALLVTRALKKAGCGPALITARPDTLVEVTERWVEENLGPGVPVFFSRSVDNPYGGGDGRLTKLELARQIGAVCFIEDNPHEFVDWPHDEIMAICFAQPWNRNVREIDTRIHRLEWPGIHDLLLSWLQDPERQHP